MEILLINPLITHYMKDNLPSFVNTERGTSPPLGLIQIATCINQNTEFEAGVLDNQVLKMDFETLKKEIKRIGPKIVGIPITTFTLIEGLAVAKVIKEVNSDIKVVLGGAHATLFPYETINHDSVDIVVVGEGEITFQDLISRIDDEEKLRKVDGIIFKNKKGEIITTKPRAFIPNLDTLPIPDRTLSPYKEYFSVLSKQNPLTIAVTSRGCPYRCTFCNRPQAGGKTWRARSPKLVVDEMEFCANLGIKEILFYDDTWTMDMERAEKICNEILRRRLKISWSMRTRVDKMNYDLLKLIKMSGCERINLGVESGTTYGLSVIKKELDLEKIEKMFNMCKKVGIESLAYFMFGLPGETRAQMLETIKFSKKIKPNFCHFTVLTPYPETQLWGDLVKNGSKHIFETWKKYAETPTTIFDVPTCNEYMNKEQLFEMCNYAYKSFYFRPNYMLKELVKVRSVGEFLRKSKAGLKMLI